MSVKCDFLLRGEKLNYLRFRKKVLRKNGRKKAGVRAHFEIFAFKTR
jgi:hypothetical protein